MELDRKDAFFSFVIPAHNEERYLAGTLLRLGTLAYPKDFFEVIVVENGSTDATFRIAQGFESGNMRVFKNLEKGVSKAKNFGLEKISPKSDWIVFLDADTILEQNFLRDLNEFFQKNKEKNLAIGTTRIRPLENRKFSARCWFRFYDGIHRFTHTSFAIQIMNAKYKNSARFDENMSLAEDLQLIHDLLHFGKFFFVDTNTVFTSTRRFDKIGWWALFFKWLADAQWRKVSKNKKEYPTIR